MQELVQGVTTGRSSGTATKRMARQQKGAPLTPERIEGYLDGLTAKGRVQGTIDWYRRGMNRLYQELPEEDKTIRRGTLKQWREKLVADGYSPATINQFIVAANGYLEYVDAREFQLIDKLDLAREAQPELTRSEYLRMLQTARTLGRERVYLLVKLFANTDLPLQELPKLTVEAVREGRVSILYNSAKQIIRFPRCICQELLAYAQRKGILSGPIFLTRDGTPMSRTNVSTGIRQLCRAAQVPEEKGSPRCLRKLYQTTREGIERSVALLVEQTQDRLLEEEQLSIGWENQ